MAVPTYGRWRSTMQTTRIRMLSMSTYKPRWVDPCDILDAGAFDRETRMRMQNEGNAEWCTEEVDGEYVDRFVRVPPEARLS